MLRSQTSTLQDLVDLLAEQFGLMMPDQAEIASLCSRLRKLVAGQPDRHRALLLKLPPLLVDADGDDSRPVLRLLGRLLPEMPRPWPFLEPLLGADHEDVAAEGLKLTFAEIRAGRLNLDRTVLRGLAGMLAAEDGPLAGRDARHALREVLDRHHRPGKTKGGGGLVHLLRQGRDPDLRLLAASLLDLDGTLPDEATGRLLLGEKAWPVLAPYLAFTRASHRDLITLCGPRGVPARVAELFREATARHGEPVVRQAVAKLGWERVNRGLRVECFVSLEWPGCAPLFVHPEEACLFPTQPPPVQGERRFLVTAQGGSLLEKAAKVKGDDPVGRFRRMNVAHAELLGLILEVTRPDRAKIERILKLMDAVVADFNGLFGQLEGTYGILTEVWQVLKRRADHLLAEIPGDGAITPRLTRLVLAFEDPRNLGEVRTVHGLKRYLHQEGLKLGFRIVGTGQSPNRTVDLLLLGENGQAVRGPVLRFAELEAGLETEPDPWLPSPVQVACEGLAWQLLRGVAVFPALDVFIFGNEVQYYLFFRNHPAFLRVDFSPPQRGGMLDLEYYGVSNYEADTHPDTGLEAIRRFYRAQELDVRAEGSRLFVRYDKERCSSLPDLLDKVRGLFRFAPFMMDLDWIVGSLALPAEGRGLALSAWADRFRRAGILPVTDILTGDRRGILLERKEGPAGQEEKAWSGKAPYTDRQMGPVPADFWAACTRALEELNLPVPGPEFRSGSGPVALLDIQSQVLQPVRQRVAAGQLLVLNRTLTRASDQLFRQEHETQRVAALLTVDVKQAGRAVAMARPLAQLDKFLPLEPCGTVGQLSVERGRLPLRGGDLLVCAARDGHGVVRLGFCAPCLGLSLRRTRKTAVWRSNVMLDSDRLWALLRGANYLGEAPPADLLDDEAELREIQDLARLTGPELTDCPEETGPVLGGLAAAPGRATGRAVFGTAGRRPEDLRGAILIAREVRPTDGPFLFQAAAVISTGGAVLSHAALLAIQFGKPAMLARGQWDDSGPQPVLRFTMERCRTQRDTSHGLQVTRRSVLARETCCLREGDLLALDASQGVARVLGQNPDTLVLWQGFRMLAEAQTVGGQAARPREVMENRAQALRARHQIGKACGRLSQPAQADFAVEEILGEGLAATPVQDRADLLAGLLANPGIAPRARQKLGEITGLLATRFNQAEKRYTEQAPNVRFMFEVLSLRLGARLQLASLELAREVGQRSGAVTEGTACSTPSVSDGPALARLRELRGMLTDQLATDGSRVRHLLRRLEKMDRLLPEPNPARDKIAAAARRLAAADTGALKKLKGRLVLGDSECGHQAHQLTGWKAANLAEMDLLAGPGVVPGWFVVTDAALQSMLTGPAVIPPTARPYLGEDGLSLGEALEQVLQHPRLEPRTRSELIRELWIAVQLPPELIQEIARAHHRLQGEQPDEIFMALRSSSCDEDSETAMQAGVYDTFLFIRGRDQLLDHLRLVWAGFWSERALHLRHSAGDPYRMPAGGVIVQRMVQSRASGVLQTVNVAGGNLNELVISAGLGLGEGIVSGLAAADLITVVKDRGPDSDPVHINYLTNDKPRQVVFNRRAGHGTQLEETLYHQRLRPALEYSELCELTRRALCLEDACGYPLDLEFALEGDRLWLLQARPIATIAAEYQLTLDRFRFTHQAKGA